MGVSCMNLGAHKQAVEHLLSALRIQKETPQSGQSGERVEQLRDAGMWQSGDTSRAIWDTLASALTHLKRSDLVDACLERRLDAFDGEFDF